MNFEFYIAKRILFNHNKVKKFSQPITVVAIAGIAIGIAVMILSVAIVTGFKNEIKEKLSSFNSHISIVNYDNNSSYESIPINKNQKFISQIQNLNGIIGINKYAIKAGIIKSHDCLHGVVYKGIDNDYTWSLFKKYIILGDTLAINNDSTSNYVIISKYISNTLNLQLGDDFRSYFIQDPPRMRRFIVKGIYETQLEDLDKIMVFADIKHIQKLNNWSSEQITGFEIYLKDFDKLNEYEISINKIVGNYFSEDESLLKVETIYDSFPGIFSWLSLLDANVWVILILMLIVSGFNMISGIIVIILERINMIGILKSMGATNFQIRKIFLYVASILIIKALIIGNFIGITICLIQDKFKIISLDPETYYVSTVPINIDIIHILILNIGTMLLISLMMLLPTLIISKINTANLVKYD